MKRTNAAARRPTYSEWRDPNPNPPSTSDRPHIPNGQNRLKSSKIGKILQTRLLATPTQDPLKKARRGQFLNAGDLWRQVWGRGGREVKCTWPRQAEPTKEILVRGGDVVMRK